MATINNSNTSHERRRRSAPAIATLRLTDLPDALLASVASYLPHTSCAALVMAMTSSPDSMLSHRPSATCRAVVSQVDWSTIDIGDVEQSCDLRLADGHLRWFLTCIDAASRVKSLKLTHCFHITGAGLKPLRGTKVLKEIDLSLVGIHESPDIEPLPAISEGVVLPILDSIIESEGNSLSFVYFPKKWREERSEMFNHFLGRYEELVNNRRVICSSSAPPYQPSEDCAGIASDEVGDDEFFDEDLLHYYGKSRIACYQCKKCYCGSCRNYDYDIEFCKCCEKFWCSSCNEVYYCQGFSCPGPPGPERQSSSCKACGVVKCW